MHLGIFPSLIFGLIAFIKLSFQLLDELEYPSIRLKTMLTCHRLFFTFKNEMEYFCHIYQ